MFSRIGIHTWVRITGGAAVFGGVILFILAPIIGDNLFDTLWGVEPLTYIGAVLLLVGLGAISLSIVMPALISIWTGGTGAQETIEQRWSQVTQRYFELFDHDLSRPLRRILGKERELRAVLRSTGTVDGTEIKELLDEIERQAPSFRLMISNVRVLVQLESPQAPVRNDPVEPTEVIRKIVDRYMPLAAESSKDVTWWSEPSEFGIVYSDSSVIEHIVVNLVDNAVRYAASQVEVRLSKNPSHFFIRVWDDGPGIAAAYIPLVFDHGWTPEIARREEKTSSGLGLFIARTLAKSSGGDITVESVVAPAAGSHTAFLLGLPLGTP